jgi:acetyltransferase-like isoleucine patch superfamily enzyme
MTQKPIFNGSRGGAGGSPGPFPMAGAMGNPAGGLCWRVQQFLDEARFLKCIAFHRVYGIESVSDVLMGTSRSDLTVRILRRFGARVGKRTYFKGALCIDNASRDKDATGDYRHFEIGNNCYIGKKVFLDLPDRIMIEDDVVIGAGVSILTHADCGQRYMSRFFPRKKGPVRIGKGAWIGANATILCGVKIGRGAVVGACALVTSDVPEGTVYGEVPARFLRTVA